MLFTKIAVFIGSLFHNVRNAADLPASQRRWYYYECGTEEIFFQDFLEIQKTEAS